MTYILDSSVALKWVLAEPDSAKANQLRDDFLNRAHQLLAPDVFPVEIAHALTKAERQRRIPVPMGGIFWHDIMTTAPAHFPSLPLIPRAYQIASAARIGISSTSLWPSSRAAN